MINKAASAKIGKSITKFSTKYADRVRIRQSGNDGEKWSACTESANVDSIVCLAQTDKVKNCGTCGLCWTTPKPIKFFGHARKLADDHNAIVNGTTVFANSKLTNIDPNTEKCVLKKSSNIKLGTKIIKGIWKNHNILTLP